MTEAVVEGGVPVCGACLIALVMRRKTRNVPRKGRAMTEIVGWQCPACSANFTGSLAPCIT